MNNFFKVGDKVRILDGSKNKSYYGGWASEMDAFVGKIYIVKGFSERGVCLEDNIFVWDPRYLELVERKKMENKIIIDGKEYKLSAELVEKIKAEMTAQEKAEAERLAEQGSFARAKGKPYFLINGVGRVSTFAEGTTTTDDELYSIANYCRDREMMEQRALHETLNRLLWRYSEMHGGGEERGGYFIYLSGMEDMRVGHCTYAGCGDVYFKTKAVAEAAIEEVVKPFMAARPEFMW